MWVWLDGGWEKIEENWVCDFMRMFERKEKWKKGRKKTQTGKGGWQMVACPRDTVIKRSVRRKKEWVVEGGR